MAYNKNYGFEYPGGGDLYNVEDFNKNFDKVSDALDDIINMLGDKAPALHKHEADEITGVLAVENGGTGANTAKGARDRLGLGDAATHDVVESITTDESTGLPTEKAVSVFVLGCTEKKQSKYSYVIAAYNSDENLKQCADFVLAENGSNFNDLQTFISNMPSGSVVKMLMGAYTFTNGLVLNKAIIIEGAGHNTEIRLSENTEYGIVINSNASDGISNVTLKNFALSNANTNSNTSKLITMKNINGAYLYNLRLHWTGPNNSEGNSAHGNASSIITGSGYLRNIHIHDCVINSVIESPENSSYTIDFKGAAPEYINQMCVFISGCSYNYDNEFDIRILDESWLRSLALYGFTGSYNIYDKNNTLIKKTSTNSTLGQEAVLYDGTDI